MAYLDTTAHLTVVLQLEYQFQTWEALQGDWYKEQYC